MQSDLDSHVPINQPDVHLGLHCSSQSHPLSSLNPIILVLMTIITTSPRISPKEDVHELDRGLDRDARRAALAEEDKGLVYWQEWCDDKGLERIPTREQMVEFTREFVLPMEAALNERIRRDPTKGKPFCGRTVFIEPVLRYRARMQSQTSAQPKSPPVSATRDLATMPTVKIEDLAATTAEPMASVTSSKRSKRQAPSHILSPTAKRALPSRTSLATDAPEGHSHLRSSTTRVKEEPASTSLPLSMPTHSLPVPTSPISDGPVTSERKPKKLQQLQKIRPMGRCQEEKPHSRSSRHAHEEVVKESKVLNSPVFHSLRGSRDQESLEKAGSTLLSLSDIKNSRALQALALQHPTVSSTDSKKDAFPFPIREIVSIPDIWTEWTQGWMGEPSIESLIKTHGPVWSDPKFAQYSYHFLNRRLIIRALRCAVVNGAVSSTEKAIRILEKLRRSRKPGGFVKANDFRNLLQKWGYSNNRALYTVDGNLAAS